MTLCPKKGYPILQTESHTACLMDSQARQYGTELATPSCECAQRRMKPGPRLLSLPAYSAQASHDMI